MIFTDALTSIPLWRQRQDYRLKWLKLDIAAGLSVAAVWRPSAIADDADMRPEKCKTHRLHNMAKDNDAPR